MDFINKRMNRYLKIFFRLGKDFSPQLGLFLMIRSNLTNNIPFGFLNQAEEISSTTTIGANLIAKPVENQLFYYFEHIPQCINVRYEIVGYIVVFIGIIGLIYGFYKLCSYIQDYYRKSEKRISIFNCK